MDDDNHSDAVAVSLPGPASETTMKSANSAQVSTAADQAGPETWWWNHSRRMTNANTSSSTRIGCTMNSAPTCRAMAWRRKPTNRASHPKSHIG